ncbi:MAG: AzlC family ABC transporter permease [Anaerolineales bacterium]|nr:AzlC family ABC transporter permease [Anaerolineales bacterium]
MSKSPGNEFIDGVKAELPILVGVIPFGMIYGVLALQAGIPADQAQAMSAILFAGSAQFISAQLIHLGTSPLLIVLTAAVVNLRHALYSASIAPYVQKLRSPWKWLLAYLLTDEAYAVAITHYQAGDLGVSADMSARQEPPDRADYQHWYFLGAGLALWSVWQLSTAAGIFLGAVVPDSWSLDFTLALTFIALVVPNLRDRASLAAALAAGLTAVAAMSLPYKSGLMLAALVGILVGLALEKRA